MTALAGMWSFAAGRDAAAACARMLQAQSIYAPDPPASWSDGRIALGRRLFRLLPEDRFDRGPVVAADDAGVLVADLRLDNRDELHSALGIAGAEAARLADATLLLRSLDRWGEGALDRVVGDFAFAWWRPSRRSLLLARDPSGRRPLHFHRGDGYFAFASMPKGLHALPEIPRRPDREAVVDFLALLPETARTTYFEGIEKVCSGEVVTVDPERLRARRYWDPRPAELRLKRREDYAEAMREQLDRAVASRLRGVDGRVGSHLSAGLDSSAIAATAARLLSAEGGRVTAFTSVPRTGYDLAGLDSVIADEGPLAAAVAAMHPNIDHVPIGSDGSGSALAELGRNFRVFERPYLNLCNGVWLAAILDEAKRRGLQVMLTGAGGNGSFSYDGFAFLHQLLRRGRLVRLVGESLRLRRRGTRLGTIASQTLGPFVPRPAWRAIARLRGADLSLPAITVIDPSCEGNVARRAAERGHDLSCRPDGDSIEMRLAMVRRVDFGNYLKGTLGGWGIDQRDPAMDRRLIEFCLSVPLEQYLGDGEPRSLARRAFADRVPDAVVREPRKGMQAPDWHEALSADRLALREEVEAIADCPEAAHTLDHSKMRGLVEDWPEGRWNDRDLKHRYRMALLRGISAGSFMRQARGANR